MRFRCCCAEKGREGDREARPTGIVGSLSQDGIKMARRVDSEFILKVEMSEEETTPRS